MKTSSVSLLLGVCELLLSALTVSAASLTVSPNLQQFFVGASVSLRCEGQVGSDGWTLKRDTGRGTESCGAGGRGLNGSSCLLDVFKPISGVYWCEDKAGEKSEEVNITVSDKHVILEIPALPVRTGSDVTLLCKKKSGSTVAAYFVFNGRFVRPKSEHSITINMQQSDEGLYWCATDEFGSSPQSFLRVKGQNTDITSSTTEAYTHISDPPTYSFFIVPVADSLVLVLVLVVVQLLWKKHTAPTQAPPSDVTYAEVIIRVSQ
ncbi:uncharacterized protein LOC115777036 [Archocentrus centrarchus]|uniref:uncharacterized protein LOC115777036 n=1 Tax=Archocentrus centrarchus TaxID=63155 RepID=UPI0011EA4F1F|nr:uncharacterized protein LOC115777036 [Archocentrus centrarchus]